MFKEFKEFALKGNVMDMAVGIIIGGAFGTIVNSLVKDVIMPPIGLMLGKVDFVNLFAVLKEGKTPGPYETLASATQAGAVTLNYGMFFNTVISFLILAFTIFLLVRWMNRLRQGQEPKGDETNVKDCLFCFSSVNIKAVRCPYCTSELKN